MRINSIVPCSLLLWTTNMILPANTKVLPLLPDFKRHTLDLVDIIRIKTQIYAGRNAQVHEFDSFKS
jgi:hypothetical protein